MVDTLKNCPLCDSDNIQVVSSAAYRVKCFACYTSGSFGDKEEAIKGWNTRPSDQQIESLTAQLKELTAREEKLVACIKAKLFSHKEIINIMKQKNIESSPQQIFTEGIVSGLEHLLKELGLGE